MTAGRENLRVADVDRAFVADRLKVAVDEGRLTLTEYDERLRDTYAAKTYGDLDRIVGDLPGVVPPARSQLAPVQHPVPVQQPVPGQHGASVGHGGSVEHAMSPVSAGPLGGAAAGGAAASRRGVSRGLRAIWGVWLAAVSVNVVIWLLVSISAGQPIYFWPMWVAGPWGAVLLASTLLRGVGGAERGTGGADGAGRG